MLATSQNLDRVATDCAPLESVVGAPRPARPSIVMNNDLAFAGLNTPLVFGKV